MGKPAESLDDFLSEVEESEAKASAKPAARSQPTTALRMEVSSSDLGPADSLRYVILSLTAGEHYDRAIKELSEYADSKYEYPQFKIRTSRYISYCNDLINAIRAKRSFTGLPALSPHKQQELQDRALEHFSELKRTLQRIEAIDYELRLDDVRSTIWVVKAAVNGSLLVIAVLFFMEMSRGVTTSMSIVFNDYLSKLVDLIGNYFGI